MLISIFDPTWASPGARDDDVALRAYRQVQADARSERSCDLEVTDDPAGSDLVIAPASTSAFGPCFEALKANAVFRACRRKTVIYCTQDMFHFPLPGLYPACTRFWKSTGWTLPAHYRNDHLPRWDFSASELEADRDLLFSFIGEFRNHPVRGAISRIRHARSVIEDASPAGRRWWDRSWEEQVPFKQRFREHLLRSKFVLCPRGVVASSIRLFEAMEAGAAPVLIADGLILPEGPNWDEFTIFVREKDVDSIPVVLEKLEPRAAELGAAARRAWEAHFSPTRSFPSLVRWATEIRDNMAARALLLPEIWASVGAYTSPRLLRRRLGYVRRGLA